MVKKLSKIYIERNKKNMKLFNNKIQKSLIYNLIIFDFIFLSNYTKTSSNLISKKYQASKKLHIVRLAIFELLKSIKRFLRSFQFFNMWDKKVTFLHICIDNLEYINFLNILFEKYKLNTTLNISILLPRVEFKSNEFKSILILDKLLSINDYKSLSFNQFFLVNEINSFNNVHNCGAYKIYNNVNEFKKLMFLGVFLLQILKK